MILCTATDRNQTLKRYVEFTSATALSWLRTEEPEGNSADTEPSAPLVGQTIKYSVIKPGSEIPVQNYTLPEPNYYEPLLKYSAIGVANAGYGRPSGHYDSIGISTYESPLHGHYSGNLPVAYTVGSTIPESADLICTNGLHCTVVENKSFLIGMGAAGHAQGLVMGSFVTLGPKNFDSTVCQ